MRATHLAEKTGASRRTALKLLAISCGLTAAGVMLIVSGNWIGWATILFAIGIPLSILQLVAPGWILIERDAFEVRHFKNKVRTYEFARCSEFFLWSAAGNRSGLMVGFDYQYEPGVKRPLAGLSRRRFGFSECIPDCYELKPSELVDRLNRARAQVVPEARASVGNKNGERPSGEGL